MNPEDAVERLIELGSQTNEPPAVECLLSKVRDFSEINFLGRTQWSRILTRLSKDEQICLLKGLTISEREYSWRGGSVAASIWVWRSLYRNADRETALQTARWVAEHTANPYAPFGTMRHRSFKQWEYEQSEDFVLAQQRHQARLEQEQRVAIESKRERIEQRRLAHIAKKRGAG